MKILLTASNASAKIIECTRNEMNPFQATNFFGYALKTPKVQRFQEYK